MTLKTIGFDLEGSFNKMVRTHVAAIQGEINAALGTSHVIAYYPQQNPESFPSVRSWFFATGGQEGRRLVDRVQLDVNVKSADINNPDRRLARLIRDSLADRLGLKSSRTEWKGFFDVKGYFANAMAPNNRQTVYLELASTAGWTQIPDEDPHILKFSIDFKILYS